MKKLAIGLILISSSARAVPANNPNIFVDLAKKVVPSVVNISTTTFIKNQGSRAHRPPGDELFRRFFEEFFGGGGQGGPRGMPFGGEPDDEEGDAMPPSGPGNPGFRGRPGKRMPQSMSLGTGFVIDEGLILTNNHVVSGADEIKIHFTESAEEEATDGEVTGRDPELDLALIKVKTKLKLVPLPLGDSDKLEVGEFVIAVGNPFGQGHSVTQGIISAKDRKTPDLRLARYLQTDAPINPGNSGGPLVNIRGEVIGINNAIDARAQGIGFAIPISSVKAVLPQLKSKGTVARGYIGVIINDLTPEVAEQISAPKGSHSPFVAHVYPGAPADKAGIKPYDLILSFNDKKISNSSDLIDQVTGVPLGSEAKIKLLRAGKEIEVMMQITERPTGIKPSAKKKEESKKSGKKKTVRPNVGMEIEDLTPDLAKEIGVPAKTAGIVVVELDYDGPAAEAGLGQGDLIVDVNKVPVKTVDQFFAALKNKKPNLLRVRRSSAQGEDSFVVVILNLEK